MQGTVVMIERTKMNMLTTTDCAPASNGTIIMGSRSSRPIVNDDEVEDDSTGFHILEIQGRVQKLSGQGEKTPLEYPCASAKRVRHNL